MESGVNELSNRNAGFENLKPIKNMDLGIYEDAIRYAMENDEIHNIAISGPYGSGKSSVIESYKEKEQNFKCTHISLSYFETGPLSKVELSQGSSSNEESKNKKEKVQFNENVLEGKILNQLIHQTKSKEIPQTNFKIKKSVKKKNIILNAFFITLFFISLSHVLMFNKWSLLVNTMSDEIFKSVLKFSIRPESIILSISICIAILAIGIYYLIKLQETRGIFKKVNIKGTEIEIFEESKESYFDKYLNEVLYIFEHTDTNIIIFEDIDRYNVNEIFGKLREINTLINNNRKKDNKLRFFYLLKDDIFKSKDRTKFFDFIIPIVPVIDSSNSYDKFIELLKKSTNINKFNQQFLQELSLYIDDMRLLKNICNEFLIYKKKISVIEINHNKLLAIITYKNIFPNDFSDLQLNSGFVYKLFENKPEFVEEELSKFEEELLDINKNIKIINNEKLESINELDALYIVENIDFINQQYNINSSYNTRIELIKAIKEKEQEFVFTHRNSYGRIQRTQINISEKLKRLESDENYVKRKRIINQKNSGKIVVLENEKQRIENEKIMLQSNKLKNIITRENIDNIFNTNSISPLGKINYFSNIKESHYFDLIKYLLRNGWIDEDYETYMTHFYSESLSSIDKNYLLSITDQLPKNYTYELIDPEKVLSKISEVDFNNKETLNIDLLDYLLKTKEENSKYLSRLLKQIKATKNIEFINEFMNSGKEIEFFIKNINVEWPKIFQYIIYEENIENSFIEKHAVNTFYYSSKKDIEKLNENNDLSEWLSNNDSFLEMTNPDVEKIIKSLLQINVKFKWVNSKEINKGLFEAVYRYNLYELNFEVIKLFLEKFYEYDYNSNFKHKNHSLIKKKPNESLAIYIEENINEYLEMILNNCDEKIIDDYEIVVQVLNEKEINIEIKEQYISYLDTPINSLEDVKNKELWNQLLKQEKIEYSINNILNYYSENQLNKILIDFINSRDQELFFDINLIEEEYEEEFINDFIYSIMNCNEIYSKQYKMIMQQANVIPEFTEEDIDEDKINILIDLDIIPMNESILMFMRNEYPDIVITFIVHNINDYVKNVINKDNFSHDELLSLLDKDIEETYKLELLRYTSKEISIESKEYSEAIKIHIQEYNLDDSELESLLYTYPNSSNKMKQSLLELSINNIEIIISNEYELPYSLLIDLFNKSILNHKNEKEILILSLPNINLDEVKECLSVLQMDDFISLFDKKRPTFTINETNRKLLTIFKEKNWITKFYVDDKKSGYYRANGRDLN